MTITELHARPPATTAQPCPLCAADAQSTPIRGPDYRRYFHCPVCALIYVDSRDFLGPEAERQHYATHNNSLDSAGYVAFLERAVHPLLPHLNRTMRGLDYGSGPGPVLSQILRQQQIACDDFDPLFAPHGLRPPYDFICSTECFEHFHVPTDEIQRICSLLKPGGWLVIMTECWTHLEAFASWRYARDPTHTSFYHARTFDWIAAHFRLSRQSVEDKRVFLFRRT